MKQKMKKETKDAEGFIEIPFGASDSESMGWTYTIPEGFTAKIEDGKIIVEKRQSVDERIRSCIVTVIKIQKEGSLGLECNHGATWNEMLAYLEKQKEQKPTVNIDHFKSFMMQYLQDAANRKTDSEIEADTDKWAKKLLNLIEVKEQKPAEWSEEDEKILLSLHHALNCADAQNAIKYTGVEIEEASDWLFNCKGRMTSHWKPSEEQMSLLRHVTGLLRGKDCCKKFADFVYELKHSL